MPASPASRRPTWRTLLGLAVLMVLAGLVLQGFRAAGGEPTPPTAGTSPSPSNGASSSPSTGTTTGPTTGPTDTADEPVYTFVSAPDLLNADIGDIKTLPTWRPGMPNSSNKTDEDSLRRLYREMASWQPDAVFVAGDEVRGHWDQDDSDLQIFGPVATAEQKRAAIRRAGDFYYETWKARFETHGIPIDTVYPALGDHEIGDNPWPAGSFALDAVPLFKQVWADHFTTVDGAADGAADRFDLHPTGTAFDDTAYATYLTPRLLLVTVDTFDWTPGELRVDVGQQQLDWLRGVLADAPEGTRVIVQGHVPVLTPVRVRGSSSLHLDGGAESAFWQLLREYDVSLYLNGEVHAFTATQLEDGGPIQLSHGGLFAHGTTSYVVGRIYADGRITLDARTMPDLGSGEDKEPRLWQSRNNLQWKVRFPDTSTSVGTMTIDADNRITERSGLLAPYEPGTGPD